MAKNSATLSVIGIAFRRAPSTRHGLKRTHRRSSSGFVRRARTRLNRTTALRIMPLEWKYSIDGVDWDELSALYRVAPLGDKKPLHLQTVFANSMFKCFIYDN